MAAIGWRYSCHHSHRPRSPAVKNHNPIIIPTVGRVVWFLPGAEERRSGLRVQRERRSLCSHHRSRLERQDGQPDRLQCQWHAAQPNQRGAGAGRRCGAGQRLLRLDAIPEEPSRQAGCRAQGCEPRTTNRPSPRTRARPPPPAQKARAPRMTPRSSTRRTPWCWRGTASTPSPTTDWRRPARANSTGRLRQRRRSVS